MVIVTATAGYYGTAGLAILVSSGSARPSSLLPESHWIPRSSRAFPCEFCDLGVSLYFPSKDPQFREEKAGKGQTSTSAPSSPSPSPASSILLMTDDTTRKREMAFGSRKDQIKESIIMRAWIRIDGLAETSLTNSPRNNTESRYPSQLPTASTRTARQNEESALFRTLPAPWESR